MLSLPKNRNTKSKFLYALSLGTQLGFLISLPLVLFVLLGTFLDKKFHTFPKLLILCIIGGLIISFFETYYLILPFLEKRSKKKS